MKILGKIFKYASKKGFLNFLPDKLYIKLQYYFYIGKRLNLDSPKTFNEKLQWLKLNDRQDIYTTLVDKDLVKKYVGKVIGKEYIIPTLGVYEKWEDINFNKLPDKFVIKCTHDSGGISICKDKSSFDFSNAEKKIKKFLKRNYYNLTREWPYKNVKPKIIIEEFKEDGSQEDLLDYKFMCFKGKVKCSFVCSERRSKKGLAVDFFDLNWKHLPFKRHYRNSDKIIKKPDNYELMIGLSEKLSSNIPFVRVDFYEIKGKVYFGEMTFYPGGGLEEFEPDYWDEKLGEMIELPNKK